MAPIPRALLAAVGIHCAQVAVVQAQGSEPAACAWRVATRVGETCSSIADEWNLTTEELQSYNPEIDCSLGFVASGLQICVEAGAPAPTAAPEQTRTTPRPTSSRTSSAPTPTQSGLIETCNRFHRVISGDDCDVIVKRYGTFTLEDFYKWNPALAPDCMDLQGGYMVCVGVPGTPTRPGGRV